VIGKGRAFLLVHHEEMKLDTDNFERLARHAGVDNLDVLGGDYPEKDESEARKKQLETLKKVKKQYLAKLRTFSGGKAPVTILEYGHGGTNHFWMSEGQIGKEDSDELRNPYAISYLEAAEALVLGQKDKGFKEVDLSHLFFLKNACLQCDFSHSLLKKSLQEVAKANGMTVVRTPLIITPSNRGQVININQFRSALESLKLKPGEPILLRHFLDLDKRVKSIKRPHDFAIFISVDPDEIRKALGLPKNLEVLPFLEIGKDDQGGQPALALAHSASDKEGRKARGETRAKKKGELYSSYIAQPPKASPTETEAKQLLQSIRFENPDAKIPPAFLEAIAILGSERIQPPMLFVDTFPSSGISIGKEHFNQHHTFGNLLTLTTVKAKLEGRAMSRPPYRYYSDYSYSGYSAFYLFHQVAHHVFLFAYSEQEQRRFLRALREGYKKYGRDKKSIYHHWTGVSLEVREKLLNGFEDEVLRSPQYLIHLSEFFARHASMPVNARLSEDVRLYQLIQFYSGLLYDAGLLEPYLESVGFNFSLPQTGQDLVGAKSELRMEDVQRRNGSLLHGIGNETANWARMNIVGRVMLSRFHRSTEPVKLDAVSHDAFVEMAAQGLKEDGIGLKKLLKEFIDQGYLEITDGGYKLTVSPEVFAVKVEDITRIRSQLVTALSPIKSGGEDAKDRLKDILSAYEEATKQWPLYPVEARWPILKAVALMEPDTQKNLLEFLTQDNPSAEALKNLALIDAILLMLNEHPLEGWLERYAPQLLGRTIYYISPETWLAAGGLGRVGQYHTTKASELMGQDASMVTIEPYYLFMLTADQQEMPVDYTQVPVPIEDLTTEPIDEFSVTVRGKEVIAQVFKGKNKYGIEAYLIKDRDNFYTKLIYRYGKEFGTAEWHEFTEFFSKASVELVRRLEAEKQTTQQTSYRAPVLWFNDGQMGPAPLFKRMLDESSNDLKDAVVAMTTHTYVHRGTYGSVPGEEIVDEMGIPHNKWHYFIRHNTPDGWFDFTSAGIRNADIANAVSAIHGIEMGPIDKTTHVFGITNGDDRDASGEVFRRLLKTLFPESDPEHPTAEQIVQVKRQAKLELGLNPDQVVISYSGRLVPEKAGRKRAFHDENIEALVKEGAQIVIYGNVQTHTQWMFEQLQELAHKVNEMGPGKLIIKTGWGIPEQRALLAATDLQVQDSDRHTGAAEYTEADVSLNGGLQMGAPWIEGIIQRQGVILNRNNLGSGNTLIPYNASRHAYLDAMQWVVTSFNQNPKWLATYQATSVRLSRVLDARMTAAAYLRQFGAAFDRKENPIAALEQSLRGEPLGTFFRNEWLRQDLIQALEQKGIPLKSQNVSGTSDHANLKAFILGDLDGSPAIIIVEQGPNGHDDEKVTDQNKIWGRVSLQHSRTDDNAEIFKIVGSDPNIKDSVRVQLVDAFGEQQYGTHSLEDLTNRGVHVGVSLVQVLRFQEASSQPSPGPRSELRDAVQVEKGTVQGQAAVFWFDSEGGHPAGQPSIAIDETALHGAGIGKRESKKLGTKLNHALLKAYHHLTPEEKQTMLQFQRENYFYGRDGPIEYGLPIRVESNLNFWADVTAHEIILDSHLLRGPPEVEARNALTILLRDAHLASGE